MDRSIFIAARDGDYDTLCQLLDDGHDVNAARDGTTSLITSALRGHRDIALELIRRGADVFAQNDWNYDALMAVAIGNGVRDDDAFAIARAFA